MIQFTGHGPKVSRKGYVASAYPEKLARIHPRHQAAAGGVQASLRLEGLDEPHSSWLLSAVAARKLFVYRCIQ